jgi:hypothetical protein
VILDNVHLLTQFSTVLEVIVFAQFLFLYSPPFVVEIPSLVYTRLQSKYLLFHPDFNKLEPYLEVFEKFSGV